MKRKLIIPLLIYGAIGVLFLIYPEAITKVTPRNILFVAGSIAVIIVAIFVIISRLKKSKGS